MRITKDVLILVVFLFAGLTASGQDLQVELFFNFGFEEVTPDSVLPDHWLKWGLGYKLQIDSAVFHHGKYSVRIEPDGIKSNGSFGCIALAIPSIYKGKEVEVRAWLKIENVTDGYAGIVQRLDGQAGVLSLDNMSSQNVHGTDSWTMYSVRHPYPEETRKIIIGALLTGTGTLWVDDFQVLIDGKDLSRARIRKFKEYPAEKDHEFDKGSGIDSVMISQSTLENLALLGKIWGFLKYYHPEAASGNMNWDYELFRVMPAVISVKDCDERDIVLNAWIDSLGPILRDECKSFKNEEKIKMYPDYSWIDSSIIGAELAGKLKEIKCARRDKFNYYVNFKQSAGNPSFTNENPYITMNFSDAGFRLLSLFRYWNAIQYFFPYKYLIEEDWNVVLEEFIPRFIDASNELQYKLAVLSLIARIHDTHAIWAYDKTINLFFGMNYSAVKTEFVEEKAVVTGFQDTLLGPMSGLQRGDIIETVNGKPVNQIINEWLPVTSASNYPTLLRYISRNLLRSNDTLLPISYSRDGEMINTTLRCYNQNMFRRYSQVDPDTCFKLITPDIAYLYLGLLKNNYLDVIMDEIMTTRGLIIDFRCYPADHTVFTLSKYLQPHKTAYAKFTGGCTEYPGLFRFGHLNYAGSKNRKYYKGQVLILVNEKTQSSAEYHCMAFRKAPGAKVLGSTTAGADGNISFFDLPGGIKTAISGIGVYYPDGGETQRIGIVPDIEVHPTINGIKSGKDELLEKAIEMIEKN